MKKGIRGHDVRETGLKNICACMRENNIGYVQLVLEKTIDGFVFGNFSSEYANSLKEEMGDTKIAVLGSYINPSNPDEDGLKADIEKFKEKIKYATVLNPIVVGTDSHYLTKEDRYVHKSYLNSKGGEREVDSFYEFAHLMTYDEVFELLERCYGDKNIAMMILENSRKLGEKFTYYSLERKQMIPKVEVKDYPKSWKWFSPGNMRFPLIKELCFSDNIQERYWINECLDSLLEKGLWEDKYLDRIETEADVIKDIGEKLDDCLFAYFNTFKHYIDLFWECGSIVGPGRGSATGFLSNYLLGITQLDPVRWGLPYWRFLNKERAELPSLLLILGSCKKRTLTIA